MRKALLHGFKVDQTDLWLSTSLHDQNVRSTTVMTAELSSSQCSSWIYHQINQ